LPPGLERRFPWLTLWMPVKGGASAARSKQPTPLHGRLPAAVRHHIDISKPRELPVAYSARTRLLMRRRVGSACARETASRDRISDRSAACGGVPDQVGRTRVNPLILVVDDEPDVEVLFRQHFRHDLRAGRFTMEFAQSAPMALQRITDAAGISLILILSDINMPGMSGLELLPKSRAVGYSFNSEKISATRTAR
jgi:hypothetical protein